MTARIQTLDLQLNALLLPTPEKAREQAGAAEREIMAGSYRGALHGTLLAGASPEDVRHWFHLETIVELPALVASFADAADAAAQYRRASRAENTRRAYRAAVARFTG
jgi:hypothetical protein